MKTSNVRVVTVVAVIMLAGHARAQMVVADTFTGASSVLQWRPMAGACLTAGNGTGTIPACKGLPYYQGKELVGGMGGRLPDVGESRTMLLVRFCFFVLRPPLS